MKQITKETTLNSYWQFKTEPMQKYHSLYNDIVQIQQQLHVCKVHTNCAEVKLNEQSVIFAFSESPEKALQAKLEDLFHIYLEIQDSRSCKKLF